jgi:hypothetical protein
METESCTIHRGAWDSSTRKNELFRFIEKYATKVDSGDLSTPFHEWYAPSSQFHDTDGTVYVGGEAIWNFMKRQFGAFASIKHDMVEERAVTRGEHQIVTLDTITTFVIKDSTNSQVVVPRLLQFQVGKSVIEGQGTDGLQIHGLKVWWDRSSLARKLAKN